MPLKVYNVLARATKTARKLMLSQHDILAIHIYFKLVSTINIHSFAEFHRQNDSSQLID